MAKTRIHELVQHQTRKAGTFALLILLVCLTGAFFVMQLSKTSPTHAEVPEALANMDNATEALQAETVSISSNLKATTNEEGKVLLTKHVDKLGAAAAVLKEKARNPQSAELEEIEKLNKQLATQATALLKKLEELPAGGGPKVDKEKLHNEQVQVQEDCKKLHETAGKIRKQLTTLKEAELAAPDQAGMGPWVVMGLMVVLCIVLLVMVNKATAGIPKMMEDNVFEPLKEIKKATREIVKNGKLEEPIGYEGRDEIGDLIKNFNEMATVVGNTLQKLWEQEESNKESNRNLRTQEEKLWGTVKELKRTQSEMAEAQDKLRTVNSQLEHMNTNLDRIVHDRTQALQDTLTELKGTQNKMILSEKMAVLGQLVAGVAHEINSPLGAIKSSMANIKDSLPDLMNKLPLLVSTMTDEQRKLWLDLQEELKEMKNEHIGLKEQRELRKQFVDVLEDHDVDEPDDVARNLIDAGFRTNLEKYIPLFSVGDPYDMSRLIYQLGAVYNNTKNVELAINKTNKIVFTLKNYSRRQDDDVLLPVNMKESLETILVLYNNKIKHGIDLTTDFGTNASVMGNGDELGQIWTNIITNAIQAMGGKGHLDIKLWQEGSRIKVAIKDEGPGIPEDIREKIFEPFFTTKKKGEGTGLGLDICKKIIEKHGGTIVLDSEVGKGTVFTIDLPALTDEEVRVAEAQAQKAQAAAETEKAQ